jgi:inositol phosphorylceramide synthase catalytic subunit
VCSIIMFLWAPPKTVPVFARAFGYMSMIGVATQVIFPCSAPWYENMYGLAPANYSIHGEPAGLARVDKLFGKNLYTSTFTASPMVFGAFPSLHSGDSTLEALFMSYCFPKLRPLFAFYVLWLWWATMYLSHHYAVDLVAGSILAAAVFYFSKTRFLPRIQPDKFWRWDYDYIEIGNSPTNNSYELAGLDKEHLDSDEWTIGSSSSISSGSLSPVDEPQSIWEGETVTSHSDVEAGR